LPVQDLEATSDKPEEVHTPNARTIEEVGTFLGVAPYHQIKTMAYFATFQGEHGLALIPVVVLLRGDHSLNETKLGGELRAGGLLMMDSTQIPNTFGAPHGYLGPVSLNAVTFEQLELLQDKGILPKSIVGVDQKPVTSDETIGPIRSYPNNPIVILDAALEGRTNLIAGANKEEYHLRNVTPGRDFKPTLIADVRNINEGEPDPIGGQPLRLGKAVEIGHIFKLGCKYTESMGSRVLNAEGKEVMPIMGCYGIGIERILTAAIESSAAKFKAQFPDVEKTGEQYAMPTAIAPFEVVVTITNVKEAALLSEGEKIAGELSAAGLDVLLDDRDERAGVKFKDAELIGIPYRINIGKKLSEGKVELVDRLTGTTTDLALNEIAQHLKSLVASSKS